MATDIIEDASTYPTMLQVPTNGTGNHGEFKSLFAQQAANRLGYLRARQLSGTEHPLRHGLKATMVALTGMAAGDMYYATDVDRLYRWESSSRTVVGDDVLAGSSGRWVTLGIDGQLPGYVTAFGLRDHQHTAGPGTGAYALTGTLADTGIVASLASVKTGDKLECQARVFMGGFTGSGQVEARIIYNDGTGGGDVEVPGSLTPAFVNAASEPVSVVMMGCYTVPADKTATASVKVQARRVGPSVGSIDFSGGARYHGLIVRCMVP